MSDVGPGPAPLIIARIENLIKKLEFSINSAELNQLELDEQKRRGAENIEALKKELLEERENLKVTVAQKKEEGGG